MTYGTVNADTLVTSTSGGILGAGNASIMKNRIINGAMMISQRNGTTATSQTNGSYNLDRYSSISYTGGATTGKFTVTQSSTAPAGFINSLLVTASTATSTSATDIYTILQIIEGYNISDLGWGSASNGKIVTLSFWTRSSATGTFGGNIRNQNSDWSYPFTYTISSANTFEYKTITIPAPTAGGTWQTDNSAGIYVFFNIQVGTSFSLSATGAWQNSGAYGASGCVNLLNNSGATWYMTGLQLEVGSSATGFEYVNYQTSLANCQRYYAKMGQGSASFAAFGSGMYNGPTSTNLFVKYPTTMRASPTLSYGGNVQVTTATTGNNITAINATYMGLDSCLWQPSGVSGTTGYGAVLMGNSDNTCYVAFSAEL